jgi:hypothetical protein
MDSVAVVETKIHANDTQQLPQLSEPRFGIVDPGIGFRPAARRSLSLLFNMPKAG